MLYFKLIINQFKQEKIVEIKKRERERERGEERVRERELVWRG